MGPLDPAQFQSRVTYNHAGAFYSLCVNRVNGRLHAGSTDNAIYVYDPLSTSMEPVAVWKQHENYVSGLAFVSRPPLRLVISASYDRKLAWWDADLGQVIRVVPAHQGWVRDVEPLPDGGRLVSIGDDMLVKLWDTDTGKLQAEFAGHATRTPQGHVTALYALAVSPDGQYIATGDRIGEVRVWESATGRPAQVFHVPILYTYDERQRKRSIGGIRSLAFSPDGTRLAVGGIGQVNNVDGLEGPAHVEVWDWRKPEALAMGEAEGHKGIVNHLAFDASAQWLIGMGGGSDDGLLALWEASACTSTPLETTTASAPAEGSPAVRSAAVSGTSGTEANSVSPPAPLPALVVHRIKSGGHVHRFFLDEARGELYAAGHGKLEVWRVRG